MEKRQSWSGMCGFWSFATKAQGWLSLSPRYLEVQVPFHGPVRFAPGHVSVETRWVIPYLCSTVTLLHDVSDYPSPLVFHPSWPCSFKPISKALERWGYITTLKLDNKASSGQYDHVAGQEGRVVTPLNPYGEIEIQGQVFSALLISGETESDLVEVVRNGNTALLVRAKHCLPPPDPSRSIEG